MTLVAVNPTNGDELGRFEERTESEIDEALRIAQSCFSEWRWTTLEHRVELLRNLAGAVRGHADELAELATLEMGKVLTESIAEVEKSAGFCDYYAEHAAEFLAPVRIDGGQTENWVRYEPLGAVLAVMPWNFPYVQVFRFAPAMLAAGNVVVLKHASNVPQCALKIEELFAEAGFPAGAFTTLLVGPSAVEHLLEDERIRAVTLTGSEAAGSKVAEAAGRELKHSVMELGGSDPFIVLDDADIRDAAAKGCKSRMTNAGQACINAKRFIVVDAVADEFEKALTEEVEKLRVGDPLYPEVDIGPMASQRSLESLREQVEDSLAEGARILTGGFEVDGPGSFVRPLVLSDVSPTMRVFREETFGPVAAIVRVPDEESAVRAANDSVYGLGASVWTGDMERGRRMAERLEAGMVFVNEIVVSDSRLPFGGSKRSGYGRELGKWGIHEFTQLKSVALSPSAPQ